MLISSTKAKGQRTRMLMFSTEGISNVDVFN